MKFMKLSKVKFSSPISTYDDNGCNSRNFVHSYLSDLEYYWKYTQFGAIEI